MSEFARPGAEELAANPAGKLTLANLESSTALIGILTRWIFVDSVHSTANHKVDVVERWACVPFTTALASFMYHQSLSLLLKDADETEILQSGNITHRLQNKNHASLKLARDSAGISLSGFSCWQAFLISCILVQSTDGSSPHYAEE